LNVPAPLAVKVNKAAPGGATAVAVTATSDRLNRVPGVRKAALDRAGFTGAVGTVASFDDGERTTVVVGLGPSASVGADELRRGAAGFARAVSRHRRSPSTTRKGSTSRSATGRGP
jgi:hypothetical protein